MLTVLWDNDGVLVDTEGMYFQACQEVLGSVGIKAEAQATLSGTPTYSSQPSEIRWDGGSAQIETIGHVGQGNRQATQ